MCGCLLYPPHSIMLYLRLIEVILMSSTPISASRGNRARVKSDKKVAHVETRATVSISVDRWVKRQLVQAPRLTEKKWRQLAGIIAR